MLMKEIFITFNLLRCIFGISNERLKPNEIVHQTENQLVIHIASAARCRELFTVDNLCFGECLSRDKKFMFCGKLIFYSHADKRTYVSYIMSETNTSISTLILGGIQRTL